MFRFLRWWRPVQRRRGVRRTRLGVEMLENRSLLAAVFVVDTAADVVDPTDGLTSLREAIIQANRDTDADIIHFGDSLNKAIISLADEQLPTITADLTIVGPAGRRLTIDAHRMSQIFVVGAGVTVDISRLNMTGGRSRSLGGDGGFSSLGGGGIFNAGALTITDTAIRGNQADSGGGIFNSGTLTIIDSLISDNSARDGNGGGIRNAGTLTIAGSSISDNNTTFGGAGGVDNSGVLTITGSTIRRNHASDGGGGVDNSGVLTITGSSISGNVASSGGGVVNSGILTITGSTISGNTGTFGGGGIDNRPGVSNSDKAGGNMTITGSTVSGNSTRIGDGGGILNAGTATIAASTVSDNRIGFGAGGGIDNLGNLTVIQSTISGNEAHGGGGISNSGTLSVSQSTISGNRVASFDHSGGQGGGGILSGGSGTVTIGNSIVAGNTFDVRGTVTSQGHNLIGNGGGSSGFTSVLHDLVGTFLDPIDPHLGPLRNNVGPTQTHALLRGSPAIDAGDNNLAVDASGAPLATDQRGFTRRVGAAVDIGAVEFGSNRPLLQALIDLVSAQIKLGVLNHGQGQSLLAKLNLNENAKANVNKILSFNREVERLEQKLVLPKEVAKELLAASGALLKSTLGDGWLGQSESDALAQVLSARV